MEFFGQSGSAYEQWLLEHVRGALCLRAEPALAVCWGTPAPAGAKAAVIVPRAGGFERDTEALKRTVSSGGGSLVVRDSPIPTVELAVDVFSWIGWFVSRAEEYRPAEADARGRFPRASALAEALDLMERPVADLLVLHLREAIKLVAQQAGIGLSPTSPWPGGKRFAVCLTHDVDHAIRRSALRSMQKVAGAAVSLATGKAARARRRISEALGLLRGGRFSPYWLFEPMAEMEDARGFRSAFYLLPHESDIVHEQGARSRRYDLRRPEILEAFRRLATGGWEIGLHTTYGAHDDPGGLGRDWRKLAEILGDDVPLAGGRSHYMRFRVPDTWGASAEAGMLYDASMGWQQGMGFRSGTCWPYRPFDMNRDRPVAVWEIGTHLMDSGLASLEAIPQAVRKLLESVSAAGGCLTLLFHPSPPLESTVGEYLATYEAVLDMLAARDDAWVATPRQVVECLEDFRGG